jgi:peptide/histidine transporter 3/4
MYLQGVLIRYSLPTYYKRSSLQDILIIDIIGDIFFGLFYMLYPLFGLLADVWIGRYRAITVGIIMCFISFILGGLIIIADPIFIKIPSLQWTSLVLVYFIEIIGFINIRANIVQYNVDHLIGASSDRLTAVIYWHATSQLIAVSILQLIRCLVTDNGNAILLTLILSGVSVSIVLVSHSLCKHWLEPVYVIDNPIKLIVKVLNYARKHKYPENRSALTYWEEENPSRLDLGKEKYGGPFTEEQVENVKTILNMLPLFIAVFGLGCTDNMFWKFVYGHVPIDSSKFNCLVSTTFFRQLISAIIIVLYIAFSQYLYKYIPSMLKRIGIGLIFALFTMVSYAIVIKFLKSESEGPYYYHNGLIIPQVLFGVGYFLIFPTSLEFTIAQSPIEMRSVMIGLWYVSIGAGYIINITLKYHFCPVNKNEYICAKYQYFIMKSCITFLVLIIFIVFAVRYKFRVRENEVNIHQIVDDHYQRYLAQADAFSNESSSCESSDIS